MPQHAEAAILHEVPGGGTGTETGRDATAPVVRTTFRRDGDGVPSPDALTYDVVDGAWTYRARRDPLDGEPFDGPRRVRVPRSRVYLVSRTIPYPERDAVDRPGPDDGDRTVERLAHEGPDEGATTVDADGDAGTDVLGGIRYDRRGRHWHVRLHATDYAEDGHTFVHDRAIPVERAWYAVTGDGD
jgi:hypothetical protein